MARVIDQDIPSEYLYMYEGSLQPACKQIAGGPVDTVEYVKMRDPFRIPPMQGGGERQP